MKSVSENLKKDTVLTVEKSSIIINLKKNIKLSILDSSELFNLEDNNTAIISIEQFIKKKTSEVSSESSSNYSFNSIFINDAEIVYKLCTCLLKIVSLTMMLNTL